MTAIWTAPAPQAPESITSKPTKDEVIDAICAETNFSRVRVTRFVNWAVNTIARSRNNSYASHYLTHFELRAHHPVLDAIAPDRSVAEPGSAHAILQDLVLRPELGELGILHDRADEPGSPRYCTVQVRMSVPR